MYWIRRVLRVAVLGGAMMLAPLVGTAWAEPPSNDTFANATVISALPFSQTLDTTQATVDQTDTDALNACGFSNIPVGATVWYAFTPSTDQAVVVDLAGTSYFAGVAVVTGAPSSFSAVSCSTGGVEFVAHPGQTYFVDAVEVFGGGGGTLDISVTGKQAPVFAVDPVGEFDSKTGAATVSGVVSCPTEFSSFGINVSLDQPVGRGAVSGSASASTGSCGVTPTAWSATIQPSNGRKFVGGHADVRATFTFCDQFCGPDRVSQSIKLRP